MFNFFRKIRKENLSQNEVIEYLLILNELLKLLNDLKLHLHAEIIQNIIDKIKKNNFKEFQEEINSVDMWGGSGAVWEIYIKEEEKEKEFRILIIKLIDLMEKTKILGKGIIQIKQFLSRH